MQDTIEEHPIREAEEEKSEDGKQEDEPQRITPPEEDLLDKGLSLFGGGVDLLGSYLNVS